jgi:hypothetical protein
METETGKKKRGQEKRDNVRERERGFVSRNVSTQRRESKEARRTSEEQDVPVKLVTFGEWRLLGCYALWLL